MGKGRRAFFRRCREALLQHPKRRRRIVRKLEKVEIFAADRPVAYQRLEVDDLFPVTGTVEHNRNRTIQLPGLLQSQNLEHFVQRAEASGECHERPRQMCEPEFAHEEVVKLDRQFAGNVRVGPLLMRQSDVQADRPSPSLGSATIGCLHDPSASARTDDVSVRIRRKAFRPCGDKPRQLASLLVIAPKWTVGGKPRRSEKHNRVVNTFAAEDMQRFEVLRQDTQRASRVAVEKLLVFVSERAVGCVGRFHDASTFAKSTKPRSTSVSISSTRTRSPTSRPLYPCMTFPSAAG